MADPRLRPRLKVPHHIIMIGDTVSLPMEEALCRHVQVIRQLLTDDDWRALDDRSKYLRLLQFQDTTDSADRVCAVYLRQVDQMQPDVRECFNMLVEGINKKALEDSATGSDLRANKLLIGEISYSLRAFFFVFTRSEEGPVLFVMDEGNTALFINNDPQNFLVDYANWWSQNSEQCMRNGAWFNMLAGVTEEPLASEVKIMKAVVESFDDRTRADVVERLKISIEAERAEAKLNGGFASHGIGAETTIMGFGFMQLTLFMRDIAPPRA